MRDQSQPICLLLLPRVLEDFILRDQAEDLLRARGVVAADPPRVPYGALGRLPDAIGHGVSRRQARRLIKALPGWLQVVVIFHPFQQPLAEALIQQEPRAELWYGRWDRFEHAHDAAPRTRARLLELHETAAEQSALTFVASEKLAALEEERGREAELVGLAADRFPAPDPSAAVIAVSLGHLGRRTDWSLLRSVGERMPELTLLLVGERHDDEAKGDPDFARCCELPNLVWLGRRSDEEAARLILCADVGIVPFTVEPFNDAGLPYRVLKYALLGRHTVAPELAGIKTWGRAVTTAPDAESFITALRTHAGARTRPDLELRDWALEQTARTVNAPLWGRLNSLGVDTSIG